MKLVKDQERQGIWKSGCRYFREGKFQQALSQFQKLKTQANSFALVHNLTLSAILSDSSRANRYFGMFSSKCNFNHKQIIGLGNLLIQKGLFDQAKLFWEQTLLVKWNSNVNRSYQVLIHGIQQKNQSEIESFNRALTLIRLQKFRQSKLIFIRLIRSKDSSSRLKYLSALNLLLHPSKFKGPNLQFFKNLIADKTFPEQYSSNIQFIINSRPPSAQFKLLTQTLSTKQSIAGIVLSPLNQQFSKRSMPLHKKQVKTLSNFRDLHSPIQKQQKFELFDKMVSNHVRNRTVNYQPAEKQFQSNSLYSSRFSTNISQCSKERFERVPLKRIAKKKKAILRRSMQLNAYRRQITEEYPEQQQENTESNKNINLQFYLEVPQKTIVHLSSRPSLQQISHNPESHNLSKKARISQLKSQLDPENYISYKSLGRQQIKLGLISQGITNLQKAHSLNHDQQNLQIQLVQAYITSCDQSLVRQALFVLDKKPTSPYRLYLKFLCYDILKQEERAIEMLQRAVSFQPNNASFLHHLSMLALNNKNIQKYIRLLKQIIDINPFYINSTLEVVKIMLSTGDLDKAIHLLTNLNVYLPQNLKIKQLLAFTLEKKGQNQNAAIHYQQILEVQQNLIAIYQLGKIKLAQNKKEGAHLIKLFLQNQPSFSKPWVLLADYQESQKRFITASQCYQRAYERQKNQQARTQLLLKEVSCLYKCKQWRKALRKIRQGGQHLQCKKVQMQLLFCVGNHKLAIELYEEHFKTSDNPILHYNISNSFLYHYKFQKAYAALQKAVSLQPEAPQVFFNIAQFQIVKKDYGLAEKYILQGIQKGGKPKESLRKDWMEIQAIKQGVLSSIISNQ